MARDAATDFRGPVNDFEWKRKRQVISRFAFLKESDPSYADRFLSHILKPRKHLELALRADSGNVVDTHESLEVLQADLFNRATSRSPGHTMQTSRAVAYIRFQCTEETRLWAFSGLFRSRLI